MQFTSFLGIVYVSVGTVSEHKITWPMFGRDNKFILLYSVHSHGELPDEKIYGNFMQENATV